jgi:gliding motility-associated lipoprotein GldH
MSLLISCNHVYKEYKKEPFTTLSWKKGGEVIFYPEIDDVAQSYELILGIRHVYGARIRKVDVTVKIISPSGKTSLRRYAFDVMNAQDEYLADCAGDLCDLESVVDHNFKFSETGKYQFIVTHNASQERIRGIMEFGLIISSKNN